MSGICDAVFDVLGCVSEEPRGFSSLVNAVYVPLGRDDLRDLPSTGELYMVFCRFVQLGVFGSQMVGREEYFFRKVIDDNEDGL